MVGILDSAPRREAAHRLYTAAIAHYPQLERLGFEVFYRQANFSHDQLDFRLSARDGKLVLEQRLEGEWAPVPQVSPTDYAGLPQLTPLPIKYAMPQVSSTSERNKGLHITPPADLDAELRELLASVHLPID